VTDSVETLALTTHHSSTPIHTYYLLYNLLTWVNFRAVDSWRCKP